MSEILYQALADLNLQPGQCERIQVNGYEVEIRRIAEGSSEFANMVMLEPWVWFPDAPPVKQMLAQPGTLPLPDPPVIPSDTIRNIPVHYAPHPLPVPPELPADDELGTLNDPA